MCVAEDPDDGDLACAEGAKVGKEGLGHVEIGATAVTAASWAGVGDGRRVRLAVCINGDCLAAERRDGIEAAVQRLGKRDGETVGVELVAARPEVARADLVEGAVRIVLAVLAVTRPQRVGALRVRIVRGRRRLSGVCV